MITEEKLIDLGFTEAQPGFWRYVYVGKAMHFRVHFNVVGHDVERFDALNSQDPTTQLVKHFDMNGDTSTDVELENNFRQWLDVHK